MAKPQALGAEFRIHGDRVDITNLEALPQPLAKGLRRLSGLAWHFLGAGRTEKKACTFFDTLSVRLSLVQDAALVPFVLAELDRDLAAHSGTLGIDVETAPLPAHRILSPPIRLNKDGALSAVQPTNSDRTALDPCRSYIAVLQLFGGGRAVYVFHGEDTIAAVLGSTWLRSHDLVAHHAGLEIAFLPHWSRHHPVVFENTSSRGRIECSSQAHGLLHGVGFNGSGRALEDAAKAVLSIRRRRCEHRTGLQRRCHVASLPMLPATQSSCIASGST